MRGVANLLPRVVSCCIVWESSKGIPVYAMERQQLIERELREIGRVSVVDLARRFDVTTETVRRDLVQCAGTSRCCAASP